MLANPVLRAIEARGLTRAFGRRSRRPGGGEVRAVDGLDLEIARGELFGLVGPDGAGKTTTLRLLAAILDPTAGSACVAGFDTVRQAEAVKRRIGYMSQQFSLYGDLSVWENLCFYADVFGVRGRERQARIDRLLDFANLRRFRERRAVHLSGGMQKKLGLACTLIHEPEVLLLDEPTTGVDPVSRREFWDILTQLRLSGTTMVVSTPYMDEAERCSRVGLMYGGRMIECEAPEAIRARVQGELLAVRTGDLAGAGRVLDRLPGVLETQVFGDTLHVFVDDAGRRQPEALHALAGAGVDCQGIRRAQPRMEEAFISIVRHKSGVDGRQSSASV
jgi:ABC-2 type transport system ATP-binding protein